MSEQQERQPHTEAMDRGAPTPDEVDEALQQAMRREAATRQETPDSEQIQDSANQEGMGHRGSGRGRHEGRQG